VPPQIANIKEGTALRLLASGFWLLASQFSVFSFRLRSFQFSVFSFQINPQTTHAEFSLLSEN